jgi:hypothetical protein
VGEGKGVDGILVRKPEGKIPLGRPRLRWEDNIEMNLQEVGFGVWTGLSCLRIQTGGGNCECGNEPSGSIQNMGNFLTICIDRSASQEGLCCKE